MECDRINELEALKAGNLYLARENAELRKMIEQMQENIKLLHAPMDQERQMHSLSAEAQNKPADHKETDTDQLRIIGEIAFQLDSRIIHHIFQNQRRLYGVYISNIEEKIIQMTTCPLANKVDEKQRAELNGRYHKLMNQLKKLGYDQPVHSVFSVHLINTYGIIEGKLLPGSKELESYSNRENVLNIVTECTPNPIVKHVQILLRCLHYMSEQDGKPLFLF